ncbi:MTP-1 family protein [Listeria seeligeri]|nr:DUF1861 family protein [Listeria seeligeri]MBC1444595.1 DUF1861 family protein [Listeria seeligeri]MBC1542459.1 DUF1861 family protein [Listeria seeligeri]MBC1584121.1 DUF1861 family protein [Listeria seeligeri]MBC1774232.1 DUF1861 family protein [Listeria seeligeri]MBC1845684.1 DUF1861 family protein [Listeria seeligeri]
MKQIQILLKEYRETATANGTKIHLNGVVDKDVYNITAPFKWLGKEFIAGRVESRDSELAEVHFFEKTAEDNYQIVENTTVLALQDPFVTFVQGELILGGVEVFEKETDSTKLDWRTNLYRAKSLTQFEKILTGPIGMKDLRIKELADGRILVLTRPQGEKGGRGKIGATVIDSLDELTIEKIAAAPLLNRNFSGEEWGGGNEIHLLEDGKIGVLGHIACFDEAGDRHYYSFSFQLNDDFTQIEQEKIIAERANFAPSEPKRPDLADVVFSGGLIRRADGYAELYAGIGDSDAQKIIIKDPFKNN